MGLHQIENNDDKLARRDNAQVHPEGEEYEMTGGASPSGAVDESGNKPQAIKQENGTPTDAVRTSARSRSDLKGS